MSPHDLISKIERHDELFIGVVTSILTVIGWIVISWINSRQQRRSLKDSAKMKLFEELDVLKKDVDEAVNRLSLLFNPFFLPFMKMEWAETDTEALQIWSEYIRDLNKNVSTFMGAYIKLWNSTETWMEAMPELVKAKNIIFSQELNKLSKDLYTYISYLQDIQTNGYDWKQWNQEEVKIRAEDVDGRINEVALGYLDDFMGLIYNELVAPVLGHKKMPRNNFNLQGVSEYKILTIDGIKVMKISKPA